MDWMVFFRNNYIWILAGAFVLILLIALIIYVSTPLPKRIERKIRHRSYVSMDEFFQSWKDDKSDFPGCYAVLIYDRRLIVNPMNYDDIYIGQSIHVRQRVFSHLMGHGNGNVYYGLKSGCKIYVVIQKCNRKKLNQAEKDLISYFNSTDSLNMTRGGAAKR